MRKAMTAATAALFVVLTGATVQAAENRSSANTSASAQSNRVDPALARAVAGEWRSAADKARDQYRHPVESLGFWGLQPGMTILEVQPGAGWWTEILAPYARMTNGRYYATGRAGSPFDSKFNSRPDVYGKVEIVSWGGQGGTLPPNTFDFILSARSVHGWMGNGMVEKAFGDFFRALKPGGILAIEQHRANPGASAEESSRTGYVPEAYVIEQAEKAGFRLVAKSEINANPKDTKDHPFGVWTLPPTRTSVPYGSNQPPNPSFDHSKYDAIGESDRMTLKFQKPAS